MTIADQEKERAINYLLAQTSTKTLHKIYDLRHNEGPDWFSPYTLSLGLWVRNTLQQGGFIWDNPTFAAEWVALIEEAAIRFVKSC